MYYSKRPALMLAITVVLTASTVGCMPGPALPGVSDLIGLIPRDEDSDGIPWWEDNCPHFYNPGQSDSDGDGIGDFCDSADDSDGDGVPDDEDNCPYDSNSSQTDSDGDGRGNACDGCPNDPDKTSPGNCGCGEPETAGCGDCPAAWEEYNGHCYRVTDHGTWEDAEAEAMAAGGHLVTVNDAAENEWLSETFQGYYSQGCPGLDGCWEWRSFVWIGLHRQDGEGEWVWASGEPVTYTARWWDTPRPDSHAYLHTDTHPSPGTWLNSDQDSDPDRWPVGIIELVP